MTALLHASGLCLAYGLRPLLDEVDFSLESGERVCLVGRNGEGKTSLMKILAGLASPDSGSVHLGPHARVAYLEQEVPRGAPGSVMDVVLAGSAGSAALLHDFERLSASLGDSPTDEQLARLTELQEELDRRDGWGIREATRAGIERIGLDPDSLFDDLSGGRKRQCLLLQSTLSRPAVLLLDEPTNHLDVRAIEWLEGLVRSFPGAVLFVTHDRAFLRSVSTRIVDLDRGQITSWPGEYDLYRQRKAAALEAEAKAWSEFDKRLAQEEVWIRQGIKARRTRNEGRVRALKKLREERKARRARVGSARMTLQESDRSGKRVFEAEDLSFSWPDQSIVEGFNLEVQRGDRLGIIGPNGCGKTTLLRLLLGEIQPQAGRVTVGTKLEPLYFDQLRGKLDPSRTVQENVTDRGDTVLVRGKPRHVIGYLGDFLFSPERARSPVGILSGGERNRLLLAKLFTQEANLLILDEPTNDLDTDTLELLEETLLGYQGTLILVSHDREFLNNVVTSCIAFDADGVVRHYAGGYDDWLQQRPPLMEGAAEPTVVTREAVSSEPTQKPRLARPAKAKQKLSYKQERELEALPVQIEELEKEQAQLNRRLEDPSFFRGPHEEISAVTARIGSIEEEVLDLMARWEELEALREQLGGS